MNRTSKLTITSELICDSIHLFKLNYHFAHHHNLLIVIPDGKRRRKEFRSQPTQPRRKDEVLSWKTTPTCTWSQNH